MVLVLLSIVCARAGDFDPLSIGADLSCSACEMFIEQAHLGLECRLSPLLASMPASPFLAS